MIRITSDLDTKNKLKVLFFIYKALRNIKKIKLIEIKNSHNGNYHLIIWTSHKYTVGEQFKIRKLIGDDKHRLSMDRIRKFARNTLFYKKEDLIENV